MDELRDDWWFLLQPQFKFAPFYVFTQKQSKDKCGGNGKKGKGGKISLQKISQFDRPVNISCIITLFVESFNSNSNYHSQCIMNQKKDLRKGKPRIDDPPNPNSDKFQSPLPNKRKTEDNFNGLCLHDLSPFRPIYGTINTAPNPILFNNNDLAIIETPNVKTQPRPYLDQMDEGFRQISGVIAWQQNNNHSISQDYQQIQSQYLSSSSSSSSQEEQHDPPQKVPFLLQIKPFIDKQITKKTSPQFEEKKQLPPKQAPKTDEKPLPKRITCNCKKTKCLKLYCDCFRQNLTCGQHCNCVGCHNLESYQEQRNNAMLTLMDRNPLAFIPKIDVEQHSKGCHCRKSNCLKKYCECFQAGIKCGPNCKCEDCKNDACHEKEIDSAQKHRITAKKERRFTQLMDQH